MALKNICEELFWNYTEREKKAEKITVQVVSIKLKIRKTCPSWTSITPIFDPGTSKHIRLETKLRILNGCSSITDWSPTGEDPSACCGLNPTEGSRFGFLILCFKQFRARPLWRFFQNFWPQRDVWDVELWEKGAGLIHFSYTALSIFRILNYVLLRMQIMSISRTPGTCMSQLAHKPHAVTNVDKAV